MAVYGEIDVLYRSVCTKNLAKMAFVDVFGELFYYDLQTMSV